MRMKEYDFICCESSITDNKKVEISIKHRTAQAKMLLVLSLGTAIGILPFAVYRTLQNDWYVAVLDLCIFMGMSAIFLYVYKTNNVKNTSLVLILVALVGNVFSFYLKGISQVTWIYPAMLSAYYIMSPKKGMYVNLVMLTFYIPKLITTLEAVNVATILVTIFITNIIAFVFASGLRKQEATLKKLASIDYLTGTGNRRALDEQLSRLHKSLKNHDKTASLVLIDLDHFKKINDTFGHIKGDKILVQLSQLLRRHYDSDSIFRYGGEEFLIICTDQHGDKAFDLAQEIRETVKNNIYINKHEQTISLGVAEYIKEESIDEWIHRVDLALYRAKNEGRNRVIKA
jgi:diguanylate cyclase (GGDEF)-like protein